MRKIIHMTLSLLLFALFSGQAIAQEQNTRQYFPYSAPPALLQAPAKSITCGPDTLWYPYVKELAFAAPSDSFFVDAMVGNVRSASQAYHTEDPVSVLGVQFWGGAYSTSTAPQTLTVRAYLYNVDAFNMPITALDSVDFTITEQYDFYEAMFPTPFTIDSNFAVAVRSVPNDTLAVITNNADNVWAPNYGESLAWRRFGSGTWNTTLAFFGQDVEYMIFPIVNYDLATEFTTADTNVCANTPVNFTNTSTSLYQNPMFNLTAFDEYWGFASSDSSFTWSFDGGAEGYATDSTHSFATSGVHTVSLTGTLTGYFTSCSETFDMDLLVSEIPEAEITAADTVFCPGTPVQLSAGPGSSVTYQWLMNGTIVNDSTFSVYTTSDAADYSVIVSNFCGSDTSDTISLMYVTPPSASLSASAATEFCEGGSVVLQAGPATDVTYQWLLDDAAVADSTNATYLASESGIYTVVVFGECTSDTSGGIMVTVFPLPTVPNIVQTGNTLSIDDSGLPNAQFQWYLDGDSLQGATDNTYTAGIEGVYMVEITDENGCSAFSAPYAYETTGLGEVDAITISLYPNPAGETFTLRCDAARSPLKIAVFDTHGKCVFSDTWIAGTTEKNYTTTAFSAGVYSVRVSGDSVLKTVRLVIR